MEIKIAEMLVVTGASVSSAGKGGDTTLLRAVGVDIVEFDEMLVSKGKNVKTVREDGAGLVSLVIVSQQLEMLRFALARCPEILPHQVHV